MTKMPAWSWIVAGVLLALSVALFFQYKDPMLLIFGLILSGSLLGVLALKRLATGATSGVTVRIRCRECGALNLEDAKFCSQCGKAI